MTSSDPQTRAKPKTKPPEGFRWWKCPGGFWLLTTDMRTRKGKEFFRRLTNLCK